MSEIEKLIEERNNALSMVRSLQGRLEESRIDINIMCEIIHSCVDIIKEYIPITKTYHRKIFQGEATIEDMQECSAIVQKIIKMHKEFKEMVDMYNDGSRKKDLMNFNIENLSVIK